MPQTVKQTPKSTAGVEKLRFRLKNEFDAGESFSLPNLLKASFVVVAGYVSWKFLKHRIYNRLKGYPSGPFGWIPILGAGSKVNTEKWLINSCGLYGAFTYIQTVGKNVVYVNDSHIVKNFVFNQKPFLPHFSFAAGNPDMLRLFSGIDTVQDASDLSFISANGDMWKKRRQYAMSVLIRQCDSQKLSQIIHEVMKHVFKALDKISDPTDKNQVWEPKSLLSYLAFNTIYHANFGRNLDPQDEKLSELRDIIKERFKHFGTFGIVGLFPMLLPLFKFTNTYKEMMSLGARQHKYYVDMLQDRREYYKDATRLQELKDAINDRGDVCYIDYLLYLLDHSGDKTHMTEIRALNDLSAMFGAGTDTTSATVECIVYLLMNHQDVQEKVHAELKHVLGADAGDASEVLNVSKLLKNTLYKAFIYECLRVSCIAPRGLTHTCYQDTLVTYNDGKGGKDEKIVIPANSLVRMNIARIHLGESENEHWKNKELGLKMNDMCLENWLVDDGNGGKKFKMNDSFCIFGTGARDCVGQALAIKEIFLIVAHLMLRYRFESKNGEKVEMKRHMGLTVEFDDIPVVVTKRTN